MRLEWLPVTILVFEAAIAMEAGEPSAGTTRLPEIFNEWSRSPSDDVPLGLWLPFRC